MSIIKSILQILLHGEQNKIEDDIRFWRKKICDAVFYFFSILGLFSYFPSVILSIREGYYSIAIISTIVYLFCIYVTFSKKIDYFPKAVIGSVLYYLAGLALLFILGMKGIGETWLFSATILVALLLGSRGSIIVFLLNVLVIISIYFLLLTGVLQWSAEYEITPTVWLIKSINFILLNFVIIIANTIFINGFRTLTSRSIETRNASIIGLAKLAEYRDGDTGSHLKRIQRYSQLLAGELTSVHKYQQYITPEYIEDLYLSSILHDIGKVGIQDSILLKPGALSKSEYEKMKEHTIIGGDVILEIEKKINGQSLYSLGKEIALYHHERWDGSGYPKGLKGDDIPLSARIVALIDVYDALATKRPYKEAIPHEKAVRIILEGRGSQFDPDIVDVFIKIENQFLRFIE